MKNILDIYDWWNIFWAQRSNNIATLKYSYNSPEIYFEFTNPSIDVQYTKGGIEQIETYPPAKYPDDRWGQFYDNADTGTPIYIKGDVELLQLADEASFAPTYVDIHEHSTIQQLIAGGNGTTYTHFKVQDCPLLTNVSIGTCYGLFTLDLSSNTSLASLTIYNVQDLEELILPDSEIAIVGGGSPNIRFIHAPNIAAASATVVANLITNSSVNNGILEINPGSASYATIATAATAKGWTVINL